MKLYKTVFLYPLLLLMCWSVSSQELPPLNSYFPKDYKAESQNWSISQSNNNYIYIANNRGLLEFNGANWKLYETPNETIMRSVKSVNDKIFTGFYMDFGFWEKNSKGVLEYTSIVQNKNIPLIDDEQFWNIIELDGWLLFQSLQRIYLYNIKSEELKIITPETSIVKMMLVDDTVYFQQRLKGVYKIFGGESVLVSNDPILKNNSLVNIFKNDNDLLFLTSEKGFFLFENNQVKKWNIKDDEILNKKTIYGAIQLKNKDFVIGTISNGVIRLNADGELDYQITHGNGLINNTVLSLFEDNQQTIWLGLDNGINSLNTRSPFTIYSDVSGKLGTIYTSILFEGNLYLGTNQGLFYKKKDTSNDFLLVENTQGQVWSLKDIDDTLFCGHNSGTFIIKGNKADLISEIEGTWDIKKLDNNRLIQGNFNGLNVLEKFKNSWRFKNKIAGFNNSSRYFELIDSNKIFVNHEYKGVFKLTIDSLFQKVIDVKKESSINKSLYSSLLCFNKNIIYGSKEGVFKFNYLDDKFKRDSLLSKLYLSKDFTSGKLVKTHNSNRLWAFSKQNISYLTPGKLSANFNVKKILIPENLRKGASGFENISELENQKYLIGISNGYVILDENKKNVAKNFDVNITGINSRTLNSEMRDVDLSTNFEFDNKENIIQFNFTTPSYNKFDEIKYQYKLTNQSNDWSSWVKESEVQFKNLSPGDYNFKVRSKIGDKLSENIAEYYFSIKKPWHQSNLMKIVYLISFVLLYFFLHTLYKGYYKKQREQLLERKQKEFELKSLENEKELIEMKNNQLEADIESKNRELASSTMSIIKKNEFLSTIKKELKRGNDNNVKNVINIIDKNLNNADDWNLFKEAFNNADKDFIKKIKTLHQELTPNDLRLCAYLRLNLSSKEIAPLLNISPRSVEVKRYRLRKKMNLDRNSSLTSYILDI